jgi:hypothetical protein
VAGKFRGLTGHLFRLAPAYICGRIWTQAALHNSSGHIGAGGIGKER